MKKNSTQTVRKMKLEDYEIGRTLGKGNKVSLYRWFRKSKAGKEQKEWTACSLETAQEI